MLDTAVDTNILIYTHLDTFKEHVACREALESLLGDDAQRMVLTPQIFNELVHIVTDRRRFEHPLTVTEALKLCRGYLGRSNVLVIASDEVDLINSWALMDAHHLGRNRLADTLLATTLRRHDIRRLFTRNVADFKIFPFLEPIDPTVTED